MAAQDVTVLAQRLARRYRALARWRSGFAWSALIAGLALLALTVEHAWWPSAPGGAIRGGLGVVWLAGLAVLWWRARADARRLLLQADHQVAGEEQLTTAYELKLKTPDHPFLPLLVRRCESLVRRVDPARLLPMELSRAGIAAMIFALVAFGLYLLPASWLQFSTAALSVTQPFVAEEGTRIQQLADRIKQIADREDMEIAKALADQAKVVGKAMVKEPMDALDAAKRVQGLVNLANELSEKASRKDEHDQNFMGDQYVAFEDPNKSAKDQPPPAGAATGYAGGSPTTSQSTPDPTGGNFGAPDEQQNQPNMEKIDQATADSQQPEKENKAKMEGQSDQKLEMQVLERAKAKFQQSAKNLSEHAFSQKNKESQARSSDRLTNMENKATEEMDSTGKQKTEGKGENTNQNSGSESSPSDQFGQSPSQETANRKPGQGEPEKHDFTDTQVRGQDSSPETEEKWVRQLPQLNAREIRPDGTVPIFQQRVVNAQGGSAIPREYRAVVRAYFMRLERLNVQKARGEALSTDLSETGEIRHKSSDADGEQEFLPPQAIRRNFGRTGPQAPSSTR